MKATGDTHTDARYDSGRLTHASMLVIQEDPDADAVERVTMDGTRFLKAPVVAVRQMVLNGEFLPADEIEPEVWEDTPLPVGHPKQNGKPVPFDKSDEASLGKLADTEKESGELRGNLYVNVEKAESLADEEAKYGDALKQLSNGEALEVSTAYLRDKVDDSGRYEGESYNAIQKNIRPDHLALLPNDVGACSWQDGCGAPRENCEGSCNCGCSDETETMSNNPEDDGSAASLLERIRTLVSQADTGDSSGEDDATMVNEVHQPVFDSTESESEFDTSDEDEFESLEAAGDAHLVSASGFPPESADDLSLPVVSVDGTLFLDALQSAHDDADGFENAEEIRSVVESLAVEEFDYSFDAESGEEASEETETNQGDKPDDADTPNSDTQNNKDINMDEDELRNLIEEVMAENADDDEGDEPSVREIVREEVQNAQEESERSELVEEVAANSSLEEEALQDMSTEQLNKLRHDVAGTRSGFAGRGAPTANESDGGDFPIPIHNERKKQTETDE